MELKLINVKNPKQYNIIIGYSHFIMTVEDVSETLLKSVPNIKFGLAFCEASGPSLIRFEGNDKELTDLAVENAKNIGAGHSFIIILNNAFPINIIPSLKNIPEIVNILCASANSLQVIIAESNQGRGIVGIIDGSSPKGVENENNKKERFDFLRKIGYKL